MEQNDPHNKSLAEAYDKFAHKFNELYLSGKERGHGAMTKALDNAQQQLTSLGEFSTEHASELKEYLTRDLDQTIADAQHLGDEAKTHFSPSRLGAGALASISNVLELTSNALQSLSNKAKDRITFTTGEITSAGTLTCQSCGQEVQLKQTGHIPPCPKCSATLFHKGY